MRGKGVPWAIIILLLFIFFPAGILVMLNKLHKDPFNYATNGNGTVIVGWIFFVFGIFYLIICLADSATNSGAGQLLTGVAFCCGIGLALVRHGSKYKKRGLLFTRYFTYIANSKDGSIGDIAMSLGASYDTAYANIRSLIDWGTLPNSYIDAATNCVVSPYIKRDGDCNNRTEYTEEPEKFKARTVKCSNCGGINRIAGNDNVCEYCGSPLAYEYS